MDNRFDRAFATGVPIASLSVPSVHIDLKPSLEPIIIGPSGDMFGAIKSQLTLLAELGATKLADKIQQMIPRDATSLLPLDPTYIKGLNDPTVQATIVQIAFSKAFGNEFAERFHMVKAFLALAYGESRLNPRAVEPITKGHKGLLQFSDEAKKSSAYMGYQLINQSKVLALTQSYLVKVHDTSMDNDQVVANVGRMFQLAYRVEEQWKWTSSGWEPQSQIRTSQRTQFLTKTYPKILRSKHLGHQMLMTVYHINGLSCLIGPGTTPLAHQNRLYEDVLQYYHLSRVPGLSKAIFTKLPANLGSLFKEIGDPPEDGDGNEDISSIHINNWWKAIIPFNFHAFAKGDGIKTSSYGKRDKVWDKSKKEWIPAHFHKGEDYGAVTGQPIFALFDGEVIASFDNGDKSYGQEMVLYNRVLNLKQRIGHLSMRLVDKTSPFTKVKKGDILGLAGETGLADGPHLHIEVLNARTGLQLPPAKWPSPGSEAINKRST